MKTGSIQKIHRVKFFIGLRAPEGDSIPRVKDRLEERLTSEYGPTDHRSSVIPLSGTIHRVLYSFEALIDAGRLEEMQAHADRIEKELSISLETGFLENHRVVRMMRKNSSQAIDVGYNIYGEVFIQFKNGMIEFPSSSIHTDDESGLCQDFFMTMRTLFRSQLRSMCLLRR
jgi:hypothetical protein